MWMMCRPGNEPLLRGRASARSRPLPGLTTTSALHILSSPLSRPSLGSALGEILHARGRTVAIAISGELKLDGRVHG